MTCQEFRTIADRFIDEILPSELAAALKHCRECAACGRFNDALKRQEDERSGPLSPAQERYLQEVLADLYRSPDPELTR